jgi:hypothetical protein
MRRLLLLTLLLILSFAVSAGCGPQATTADKPTKSRLPRVPDK